MTEVHSCSYYCDRPECIKAQRDELRDRLGSMTDREIMQRALEALYNMVEDGDITDKQQAMATITALRERLAQPEQEPVASVGSLNEFSAMELVNRGFALTDPLYTAPPQRTWVGLTEVERNVINRHNVYVSDLIGATEAKLKEKNT